MKKRIVVLLSLVMIAAGCLAAHFTVNPTLIRTAKKDTAVQIAESWLDKQFSLRNYEVKEAHFYQMRSGERFVCMTYSVQPYDNALKNWYAGNGESGEDRWLIDKYGLISYRMIGPFAVTGTACNTGP